MLRLWSDAVRRYLYNEGINPDTRASVEIENTALAVGLGRAETARERNSITRARHDKQWIPPDPETSRLYASYNHPRKGGEGGDKYKWRELTSTLVFNPAFCSFLLSRRFRSPHLLCFSGGQPVDTA